MSFVSIICQEHPDNPADIELQMWEQRVEIQEKRTDPEAVILREFIKAWHDNRDEDKRKELMNKYSEKLSITPKELTHKVAIYWGHIEDDKHEWREEKYGKQDY